MDEVGKGFRTKQKIVIAVFIRLASLASRPKGPY